MGRRGQSVTLSISEADKTQLEALALEFGMTWGDRPNISKLVEAIARRQLTVAPNHDWPTARIVTLNQARKALVDAGQIDLAIAIAALLLERSELSIPLRQELEHFIHKPALPWRIELERYRHRQHPFQLAYQDATEYIWHFHIRYAEIATHGDREYLDCWCEETEGNQDLPELAHNRCLRLDRIADAAITPISGPWRSGLDTIAIELHLFRRLAFAYESKTLQDEVNEWLPDQPQTRRIVRRVASTFWLIRDVLRYGADCEVIAPDDLRQRVRAEITALSQRYATSL